MRAADRVDKLESIHQACTPVVVAAAGRRGAALTMFDRHLRASDPYRWIRGNRGAASGRDEDGATPPPGLPAPPQTEAPASPRREDDGAPTQVARERSPFSLRRYLSLASLVAVAIVIAGLLLFNRHLAFGALMAHETQNNVALAQSFANAHWQQISQFLGNAGALDREQLRAHPEQQSLRRELLRQMKGLKVVKVKIYDLGGMTVFSSDPRQVGEDKGANAGFRSARSGTAASDIAFRDRFDAFEDVIVDRNLVFSYIPIRQGDGPVEGVFEVYSDVSELVARLERTQWQIVAAVAGSLLLLYLFLFLLAHRADRIVAEHSDEQRLASEARLRHQAFHDALTGLPNRAKYAERLDDAIRHARRSGRIFAVLIVDLDHFKYVNDSLGHVVGDRLLKAVSVRLGACLRETDTVARLGGDEFILLAPEVGGIDDAARLAAAVCRAVSSKPYLIDGRELRINTSIGISVYPEDGEDGVTLIKNADAALFHAKEVGRNNFQFFTRDMNARALSVLSLETSLRRAVEQQEFVLHYQPQVDSAGQVVGLEALLRWQHPDMGLVLPGQFIPIAEERGLIAPIGEWVLREACRQNRAWQDAGLLAVPVGVNVSALQFRQPDFPQQVAAALRDTGLAAEFLELEITESVIMHGAEAAIATVRRLKGMGVKMSIDDFGTGYSSLNYLKQFPIDRLKLDQSFVRGLPGNAEDLAISSAVLAIAKAMNLKVIAEGVESEEQMDALFSRQCDELQGYYFARPLPADDLARFIAGRLATLP